MKVVVLKKDKRFESRNDRSLGIQTYGENNDYPQQVQMVVGASGTGTSCLDVYSKFISGKGFFDTDFYKKIVNNDVQTNVYIIDQLSKDYAMFGGFAIHVNYNANFKIVSISNIPFEHIRFEKLDEKGEFDRVAIHTDWGRQFTQLRKWKKDDIQFIHLFNPDPAEIQNQVESAGGWEFYKGQVFYFSSSGYKTYPIPKFDSVLTDMNTEEGISNVNNRNARNNFLTAGMLIDKVQDNNSGADDQSETEKAVLSFQGDENAGKILYIQVETAEEIPEFKSFSGTNYDKEFTVTRESVQDNIGQAFSQPPILRAKDVGGNFGADLMQNAYNFYNSVTENERMNMERVLSEIFKYWVESMQYDTTIQPLSFDVEMTLTERLGEKGFDQIMNIIENPNIVPIQKRKLVQRLFDLSDEEVNDLIPEL
ncbi:MAG: hypothetical protein ACK5KP_05450 [Paludibacteraceae bacterium]